MDFLNRTAPGERRYKFLGFGGSPSLPVQPPPPPTRDDPAIAEANKKLRASELRRKGRASFIIAGKRGGAALGETPLAQPQARGAQVLG